MPDKNNELSQKAKEVADALNASTESFEESLKRIIGLQKESIENWESSYDLSRKASKEAEKWVGVEKEYAILVDKASVAQKENVKAIESAERGIRLFSAAYHASQDVAEQVKKEQQAAQKAVNAAGADVTAEMKKRLSIAKQNNDTTKKSIDLAYKNLTIEMENARAANEKQEKLGKILSVAKDNLRDATKSKNVYEAQRLVLNKIDTSMGGLGVEWGKIKGLTMDVAKGGLTMWLALITASVERWIDLDKAAGAFRKTTGLLVTQMDQIRRSVEQTNVNFAYLGVTLEKAYAVASDFYSVFNTTSLVSKGMITDTAILVENLGLASKDIAEFSSKFTSIAISSGTTASNVILASSALSEMAGVAPREVMNDMAKASSNTLMFLSKSPMQLMRATVEARRLGTTINRLAEAGRGMLNYQESMTAELEASALLNQNVSFQLSRQLAWEGKLVESREEALRQISSAGDFTRMTLYQQEALAKAAGMTVEEVTKQQNQQKMLNALKSSANAQDVAQYNKYMSMTKALRANEESAKKDLIARGREMAKQQLMQAEMDKLTNSLKAAWISIQDALLPIANGIMPIILFTVRAISLVIKLIGAVIKGILSPLDSIVKKFGSAKDGAQNVEDVLTKISKVVDNISPSIEMVTAMFAKVLIPIIAVIKTLSDLKNVILNVAVWAQKLGQPFIGFSNMVFNFGLKIETAAGFLGKLFTFGGKFGVLFGMFGKFVPIIGQVIMAIQIVVDLFGQWMDIWSNDNMDFTQKIMASLIAIPVAIYNALIKPFVDVWNWLSEKFFGNSPSQLGLSIVKGISAVGGMIFDWLTSPFTRAWNFIKELPLIKNLFGGAKDATITVSNQATTVAETPPTSFVEVKNLDILNEMISKLTDAVVELGGVSPVQTAVAGGADSNLGGKLDELIQLFKSGGIVVNLDGRKVSSGLASIGR